MWRPERLARRPVWPGGRAARRKSGPRWQGRGIDIMGIIIIIISSSSSSSSDVIIVIAVIVNINDSIITTIIILAWGLAGGVPGARTPPPARSIRVALLTRNTPSSHSKNSATKMCSKGWVAQEPLFDL